MPGDFTQDCMDLINQAVEDSLGVLGGQYAADVKESLDVSIEFPGPIRSQPGERPRRETGELQASTRHEVERLLFDETELNIVNDCSHGPPLEFGTHVMAPRPFMAPAEIRLANDLPDDLNDAVAGRL